MNRHLAARAASLLLRYPDDEVLAVMPMVRGAVASIGGPVGDGLRAGAEYRLSTDPTVLAREYVEVFDLRRRCCLYLSYYTDGDTRRRGVALVRFSDAYKEAGVKVSGGELPDFLPAVLELASVHDSGWQLLTEHRIGLDLLVKGLGAEKSSYQPVVQAVRDLLPPAGTAELVAALSLAQQGPPAEMVGLESFGFVNSTGPGARR